VDTYYINLESCKDRRDFIETNFHDFNQRGWTLRRLAATGADEAKARHLPGTCTDAEKACILSHTAAIERSLESAGPVLILEDDAMFGPTTELGIDDCLARLAKEDSPPYDLLFTDVYFSAVNTMIELSYLRKQMLDEKTLSGVIDLHKLPFCAATAYIVMPHAKRKLLELLAAQSAWNTPYDLILQTFCHRGLLRAGVVFPFMTTLSQLSGKSSIQPDAKMRLDRVSNDYRRIMWRDAEYFHTDDDCSVQSFPRDWIDKKSYNLAMILGVYMTLGLY
jgi:GR25 family glycosyltransferase involved in LPS biosynthesis